MFVESIHYPIKAAAASDEGRAVDVLVRAFETDPAVRWVYPDPEQYLAHFPEFVRAFGGKAFEWGTAYCAEGFRGAALWLPPGVHPDEEPLVAHLERTVFARDLQDAFSMFEQMGRFHPEEPHWYLPLIGVAPEHQGQGWGAVLMQHALVPCDRENLSAYLESSNPRNVPFYERLGFELLGTIQVGSSPPVFPMLRRPQQRGDRAGQLRGWRDRSIAK
jgi:ribosomal protein S18 acetylase RimI-like enzyme